MIKILRLPSAALRRGMCLLRSGDTLVASETRTMYSTGTRLYGWGTARGRVIGTYETWDRWLAVSTEEDTDVYLRPLVASPVVGDILYAGGRFGANFFLGRVHAVYPDGRLRVTRTKRAHDGERCRWVTLGLGPFYQYTRLEEVPR